MICVGVIAWYVLRQNQEVIDIILTFLFEVEPVQAENSLFGLRYGHILQFLSLPNPSLSSDTGN